MVKETESVEEYDARYSELLPSSTEELNSLIKYAKTIGHSWDPNEQPPMELLESWCKHGMDTDQEARETKAPLGDPSEPEVRLGLGLINDWEHIDPKDLFGVHLHLMGIDVFSLYLCCHSPWFMITVLGIGFLLEARIKWIERGT